MCTLGKSGSLLHAAIVSHTTNIKAFLQVDSNESFLRLYTLLVAAELALKDASGKYPMKHDFQLLAENFWGGGNIPSGVQSVLTSLYAALAALRCTFNGSDAPIRPEMYPGIRYIRLARDGFVNGTADGAVQAANQLAQDLVRELKAAGVAL